MSQCIEVTAVITDHGDMSVGMRPQQWEVQCPFYQDEDKEIQNDFREELKKLYQDFSDGRLEVRYGYEIKAEEEMFRQLEEEYHQEIRDEYIRGVEEERLWQEVLDNDFNKYIR